MVHKALLNKATLQRRVKWLEPRAQAGTEPVSDKLGRNCLTHKLHYGLAQNQTAAMVLERRVQKEREEAI